MQIEVIGFPVLCSPYASVSRVGNKLVEGADDARPGKFRTTPQNKRRMRDGAVLLSAPATFHREMSLRINLSGISERIASGSPFSSVRSRSVAPLFVTAEKVSDGSRPYSIADDFGSGQHRHRKDSPWHPHVQN